MPPVDYPRTGMTTTTNEPPHTDMPTATNETPLTEITTGTKKFTKEQERGSSNEIYQMIQSYEDALRGTNNIGDGRGVNNIHSMNIIGDTWGVNNILDVFGDMSILMEIE